MKAAEFISALKTRGIDLWQEGSALRYRARAGTLTEQERTTLQAHKAAILKVLASTTATTASAPVTANLAATELPARECRNCACFEAYPYEPLGSCHALQRMQHAGSKPASFGCGSFEPKEARS